MTNHYGDGVAHVNIARKVVDSPDDSLWQRYIQIGSPWLPLQTVMMLPFVSNEWMWRSGAAGSFISMISFVIAVLSLYRLALRFYADERRASVLAVVSVAVFVLNPSALFMQATPMTEMVFIAALLAAVCLFQRWVEKQTSGRLVLAAAAMSVATLSRYEAWPVAALAIPMVALASKGDFKPRARTTALFAAVAAAGPIYWLWHNWAIYGDALEFLTGPNSARGIYLQNRANLGWSKIFVGHAMLDTATILTAAAVCSGPLVLLFAIAGLARTVAARRRVLVRWAPAILLLVPFFFHVVSLYRGEIQIFPLSAFGLLNVRYGLLHLPAIALFAPAAALIPRGAAGRWATAILIVGVAAQYGYLISEGPRQLAVYQEGYRNGVNARPARELADASAFLKANPPRGLTLMNTGALGPLVSKGGLRFSELIHEGTARWHQITDRLPADVFTVIVEEGDPLDQRFQANADLSKDLEFSFREEFSIGKIRLFKRVRGK
ncbi:MAG: glycosyltransferase family 39 protein [Acidobacteriota bacterium]